MFGRQYYYCTLMLIMSKADGEGPVRVEALVVLETGHAVLLVPRLQIGIGRKRGSGVDVQDLCTGPNLVEGRER
eukprot:7467712-Pyramimonas_sp.AAC.1